MYDYEEKAVEPKVLRASHGVELGKAAVLALLERQGDIALVKSLGIPLRPYEFEYFGIRLPITDETRADELVDEIKAMHTIRAKAYASLPKLAKTTERVQSGRPGDHLDNTTLGATQAGQLRGNIVFSRDPEAFVTLRHVFEWNGVKVPFNPWAENEAVRLTQAVKDAMEAAAEAYRQSDECKEYEARAEAERQAMQGTVTELMGALPETLKQPLPMVMSWVTAFSEGHDRNGVKTDGAAVVTAFEAAGYKANAYVGTDPAELNSDKEKYGRYVIGQFLDILPLQRGMPPMIWAAAERFHAMT